MEGFREYLDQLEDPQLRTRMEEIVHWVSEHFPRLQLKIAWNQPVFTDHDTFIIGFSAAKQHLAVAPERDGISLFSGDISEAGYEYSKELIRIKWESPVDYGLLSNIIAYKIDDKKDCSTFWRRQR